MNDDRLRRYVEAIEGETGLWVGPVPDLRIAQVVMAVADAEVVASSVATLRVVAGVLAETRKPTVPLAAVLETLYQVAERIEAGEVSPAGIIDADLKRPS